MDSGEHEGEADVGARKALTRTARLERQDKSRNLLGGRKVKIAKENNTPSKGAHTAITLLRAPIRWVLCELDNLRVSAP
jgi:hypothetical protein